MSKKTYQTQQKKSVKNNFNNESKYNVIINQTNTYNQGNSINILLDGTFSYLNNYSYQTKENDPNQALLIKEYKQINSKTNNINSKAKEMNNNKKESNEKYIKIEHKVSDDEASQKSTNKIDYRYMKKYPINLIIEEKIKKNILKNQESQLFWFAAYGKLMKTKNLMKILNYYNNYGSKKALYNNISIKEKSIKIEDFEAFFQKNSNKLYIKYSKGNYILAKLYLLSLKEISLIFKYMNRAECEIEYDILNYLQKKGNYHKMDYTKNKFIFPFGLIYYLGDYMNNNIFTFSSMSVINNDCDNDFGLDEIKYELPKSKKIIKLIKIINRSFPDLSIDDIINYLIPEKKYINSFSKISEIKNILFFSKKFNQSRIILSSMVKDTIKGIPIPTTQSVLSSFAPDTFDNQMRNIDLFKNISFPISAIKDEYNMQIINSNSNENTFIKDITDNKEMGIKTNLDKSKKIKSNHHSKKNSKKKSMPWVKKVKKKQNVFSRSEKVLNKSNFNKINSKNRISKDNFILNNNKISNSFKYSGFKNKNDIFNNTSEFNYIC
jgi:hypothetical protein